MASDESPKIEPTLTSIETSPSISASISEMTAEAEAVSVPKAEPEVVASAEPILPPAPHLSAINPAPRIEPTSEPHIEPKSEPRIEATVTRMPVLRAAPKSDAHAQPEITVKPRVARFAMLAACVAIAASFGAVGGSIGVAKFGPMFTPAPAPVVAIHKDNVADEVKALKDTVAQLRSTTKSLSDNLSALKTSVTSSNSAQNTQIGKIAETLDRVEKTQAERHKAAAAAAAPAQMASTTQATAAAPETTGSIAKKQQQPVPMVLGEPPANLKPPIVQDFVLRRVYDGAALIEGRDGIIEVETGSIAPGLGRIEGIKRQDGRWVVVTARGLVVGR
jgi:hypothetical protein